MQNRRKEKWGRVESCYCKNLKQRKTTRISIIDQLAKLPIHKFDMMCIQIGYFEQPFMVWPKCHNGIKRVRRIMQSFMTEKHNFVKLSLMRLKWGKTTESTERYSESPWPMLGMSLNWLSQCSISWKKVIKVCNMTKSSMKYRLVIKMP